MTWRAAPRILSTRDGLLEGRSRHRGAPGSGLRAGEQRPGSGRDVRGRDDAADEREPGDRGQRHRVRDRPLLRRLRGLGHSAGPGLALGDGARRGARHGGRRGVPWDLLPRRAGRDSPRGPGPAERRGRGPNARVPRRDGRRGQSGRGDAPGTRHRRHAVCRPPRRHPRLAPRANRAHAPDAPHGGGIQATPLPFLDRLRARRCRTPGWRGSARRAPRDPLSRRERPRARPRGQSRQRRRAGALARAARGTPHGGAARHRRGHTLCSFWKTHPPCGPPAR